MKMEKVNENEVNGGLKAEEKKMLDLMANMQKQAEMENQGKLPQQSVNTVNTISQNNDDVNYWDITNELPTIGSHLLYPEGTVIEARPLKVLEVKKLASIT